MVSDEQQSIAMGKLARMGSQAERVKPSISHDDTSQPLKVGNLSTEKLLAFAEQYLELQKSMKNKAGI